MYTLWHEPQKSVLDHGSPSGLIRYISIRDCIGLLLPAYRQDEAENAKLGREYDNGCLSGVLDEVLPLLLDDHNARQ